MREKLGFVQSMIELQVFIKQGNSKEFLNKNTALACFNSPFRLLILFFFLGFHANAHINKWSYIFIPVIIIKTCTWQTGMAIKHMFNIKVNNSPNNCSSVLIYETFPYH